MKPINADIAEHSIHRAAIAAARAAKAEADAALTLVLSKRDELDNARRRLATVEANHRQYGINVADTVRLIEDLKRRIPDIESAVASAEEKCRAICADRLAEHDQAIAQAAAEIAAKQAQEEQEAAATLELNHRKVTMQAHERLAHRARQVEERRQMLKGAA